MGDELWRLVLVNNGVKLTIAGSPVLEDLVAYENDEMATVETITRYRRFRHEFVECHNGRVADSPE
jgi:hypothetical protein